ncbi:hypothetical protein LAG90_05260 [Marinilongibacter aquaticus]|uniref:hypothetical protein n=1 Tax=Marinilongibacter aquaticus TaxID=2975157 RepID=UPI0021BD4E6D|nr:hypothetical protein [Marinilongibacter aquaticus]UBM60053.1 hypothetical protein LAG90_05260 [Marinilongibacter aquaticus]
MPCTLSRLSDSVEGARPDEVMYEYTSIPKGVYSAGRQPVYPLPGPYRPCGVCLSRYPASGSG